MPAITKASDRPSVRLLVLCCTVAAFAACHGGSRASGTPSDPNATPSITPTPSETPGASSDTLPGIVAEPNARVVAFVNRCDTPLWLGFAGGAAKTPHGTTACATNADCVTGATCVPTGSVSQCFWNNPAPANGNYLLEARGGTQQVSIPVVGSSAVVWSGSITGRVACSGGSCEVSDCGDDGHGGCAAGQGFAQPATQAEITMQAMAPDFYDVEIINGVSIPIAMQPAVTASMRSSMDTADTPYFCGAPGAKVPFSAALGPCSWNFSPPSNDYVWVAAGPTACTTDADCTVAGERCGLGFAANSPRALHKTCGPQRGWWTGDQICGVDPTYPAPLNCQTSVQGRPLADLYACIGTGSCYSTGADATCCGCADWDQAGLHVPPAPTTRSCVNVNPAWTQYVQPTLAWLKAACPTAYTYPFDDMSSTFTCSDAPDGTNAVNYFVIFCP